MTSNRTGAPQGGRLLSIGEFARRSRLSPRALRLYDENGILVPAHVDPDTGYRRYAEDQLEPARLVAQLRRLDMPLSRIADVLSAPAELGADLVASHWAGVELRAASQRALARHVRAELTGDRDVLGFPEPRLRSVPEQRFLTELRYSTAARLPEVVLDSATRLMSTADRCSARAGEFTFIMHGEVSEDSDGPVELCLPVDPDAADRAGLATRVEPAHCEAYLRLTKAQTDYPQILSAYDSVIAWAAQQRRRWSGPPREVYLGFFPTAAPEAEICDVALPVSPAAGPGA